MNKGFLKVKYVFFYINIFYTKFIAMKKKCLVKETIINQ